MSLSDIIVAVPSTPLHRFVVTVSDCRQPRTETRAETLHFTSVLTNLKKTSITQWVTRILMGYSATMAKDEYETFGGINDSKLSKPLKYQVNGLNVQMSKLMCWIGGWTYQNGVCSWRDSVFVQTHGFTDKEVPVQLFVSVSVSRHFTFVWKCNRWSWYLDFRVYMLLP